MKKLQISIMCVVVLVLIALFSGPSQASTFVWITVDPPSSLTTPGSNFSTDLNISSWNGVVGAFEIVIDYDPTVIHLVDITTPLDSPFYSNISIVLNDSSGNIKIAGVQLSNSDIWETPISIGELTWEAIGNVGSQTDIIIQPISIVSVNWAPVEVLSYGQKISVIDINSIMPVADCGIDKLRCENMGAKVKFNGSASYDPDGTIESFKWYFGDGTNETGIMPNHTYSTYNWNGSGYQPFKVNLTARDNNGFTNTTSLNVTIWIAGDANGDGNVNILDASVVGLKWNGNDACADLNNDGSVNILDASIIGLNWGKSAIIAG